MSLETLTTTSTSVEEHTPEVRCPYSVQQNLRRFAERHSTEELQSIVERTKYAAYTNSAQVEHPDADFI